MDKRRIAWATLSHPVSGRTEHYLDLSTFGIEPGDKVKLARMGGTWTIISLLPSFGLKKGMGKSLDYWTVVRKVSR